MCLELLVAISDQAPGRIGARRLAELSGLVVTESRLDAQTALHLAVSPGCSCGFLEPGTNHDEGVWQLDPAHVPKLIAAIRALNAEARKYRFLAHWLGGETPRSEVRITGADLVRRIETNRVGHNVVYRTWGGVAGTSMRSGR